MGEGNDPLHHAIQCWAHNVAAVAGISPQKPIHGLFTNPLRGFEFTILSEGGASGIGATPREGAA